MKIKIEIKMKILFSFSFSFSFSLLFSFTMLTVTAVSYLNTKPFLYGLVKSGLDKEIDLQLDIPSVCAEKLRDGKVDLGLVPVAIIPEINTPHIISDYCIGTVGAVKTVSIFSNCPIEEVKQIYLDYHSRTSVELAKILIRDFWKVNPTILNATPGFEKNISGNTAALIIGDRAIGLDQKYPFVYDLGEAWLKHTGLPFVFAAWVSNRPLPKTFVTKLNYALQLGLEEIPQLMYLLPSPHPDFDLKAYFTNYISYVLDEPKKKALDIFLEELDPVLELTY